MVTLSRWSWHHQHLRARNAAAHRRNRFYFLRFRIVHRAHHCVGRAHQPLRVRNPLAIIGSIHGSLGGGGSITAAPEGPEDGSPVLQIQLLPSFQKSRLVTTPGWSCHANTRARNVARHTAPRSFRRFAGRHRLLRPVGRSGVALADQPTMALHSIPAYQQHQHPFSPTATAPSPARFTRYAQPAVTRTACAVGESCHFIGVGLLVGLPDQPTSARAALPRHQQHHDCLASPTAGRFNATVAMPYRQPVRDSPAGLTQSH